MLSLPNRASCPCSRALRDRCARASAESIALWSWARHSVLDREAGIRESKAPALTKLSKARLLMFPCSIRSAKSNAERKGPAWRAEIIALTVESPRPLMAARPYRISPFNGVKPAMLWLTSGGNSMIP